MSTDLQDIISKRLAECTATHKKYMHAFDIRDINEFHRYVTDNPQFHDNFVVHDVIEQFRYLSVENA